MKMENKIEVIASIRGATPEEAVADANGYDYDTVCFSDIEHRNRFKSLCFERDIGWLGEPRTLDEAKALVDMGADRLKIGSVLIDQIDMLDGIAALNVKVLIATGACSYYEMRQAVGCFAAQNRVIMHAVETFPTKPQDMNLLVLKTIRSNFRGELGLVDTSIGAEAALIALGLGARIFEKVLNQSDEEWPEYPKILRQAATMLGSERKQLLPVEVHAYD